MELLDAVQTYFRGEKQIALFLVALGLAWLGFSAWLWVTQQGAFRWGILIPFALIGLGASGGGAAFAWKTDAQVEELVALQQQDPAALCAKEIPRMVKVNANWPMLKATWGALILGALVLLFVAKRDWATGLALALLVNCAVVMCVDVFAERRAVLYTDALQRAAPPP